MNTTFELPTEAYDHRLGVLSPEESAEYRRMRTAVLEYFLTRHPGHWRNPEEVLRIDDPLRSYCDELKLVELVLDDLADDGFLCRHSANGLGYKTFCRARPLPTDRSIEQ